MNKNKESGQALPLTLAVLMLGALIISPFIAQAGTGIIGSRDYGQIIRENYTCDAGIEHAIWRITNDGLESQLPDTGDSITYQLPHQVNSLTPSITVTKEQSGGQPGSITDTVRDTLEFDTSNGNEPDIVPVSGDIYAIVYRGQSNGGYVKTISIASNGQIGNTVISTFQFDSNCYEPSLINVATGIYAVAYRGPSNDGFVKTLSITSDGQIGSIISTLEFDTSNCYAPDMIFVSGNIYVIAYRGTSNDGFMKTLPIASNGQIGTVISTLEFDTSNCYTPSFINITTGIYAVAYSGAGNAGVVKTLPIASNGQIGPVINTLIFDTTGYEPSLINVATDIYAVAYRGPSNDGFVKTLSITSDGQIGSAISTLEFDTADCYEPDIILVPGDICIIAYRGTGTAGLAKTVSITPDGQIGGVVVDSLTFDTICYTPCIINALGGIYVIAYAGSGNDGLVKTIEISTFSLYTVQSITDNTTITALVKVADAAVSVLSWVISK